MSQERNQFIAWHSLVHPTPSCLIHALLLSILVSLFITNNYLNLFLFIDGADFATMPCDIPGHVHEWPQAGNLQIYDCETICGICGKGPYTGGLRFLRKHVTQMHTQKDMPELVVLTEVDLVNARRRVYVVP